MADFDPQLATEALLAQASPQRRALATAYTHGGHGLLLVGWLVACATALVILRSGVLLRVKDKLQKRPVLESLCSALVFGVGSSLLSLPWDIYSDWWRERAYGLSSQAFSGWLGDGLISDAFGWVGFAIFFMLLYALVRRAPRSWPTFAGVLTSGFMLAALFLLPVFLEPLLNDYRPAPPGAVRDLVTQMGQQVGVPTDKIYIYDGSKQSNRYTANVAGLFGTARVALSDVMFRQGADLAEVRGVVGHEMGHYVHRHVLIMAVIFGFLASLGAGLMKRCFGVVAGWTRARGVGGIADPAGLPIVVVMASTLGFLGTPLFNTLSRTLESDADGFSLTHFDEPDGLAKALVKTIDYRADSPGELEEILFYDHPSVRRRVLRAMEWKAQHPRPDGR